MAEFAPGPPALKQGRTELQLGATKATVTKGPTSTTLRLVRVFKAPVERVYRCFVDPDAMVKWLPPHGFTGHIHRSEVKVGKGYRMTFAAIDQTFSHTFTGTYEEITPGKRLRYVNAFESDDPVMADAKMHVTIEFRAVPEGTEVTVLQEGIPAGPAADGAPYGWTQSFENLQRLVEHNLPS